MSRFYGIVSGTARTEATRQGTANSGLTTHCRGWDIGVTATINTHSHSRAEANRDIIYIYMDGGSNGKHSQTFIGSVEDTSDGPRFTPA